MAPPAEPRVFVVDDDPFVRESVAMLLEAHGLDTAAYGSGTEFLDAVSADHRGCVLLDVRLPDMTGLEVQSRLAEIPLRMPVIIITAFADVALAVRAMKAGAADFIQKPYTDDVLLESVRTAMDGADRSSADAVAAAETEGRIARLTPREREVMEGLVLGKQNKQIAYDLGISPRTVEIHRARVLEKMEARTHSHLVRLVITSRAAPR